MHYRNHYACQHITAIQHKGRIHTWESFGKHAAVQPCPLCGEYCEPLVSEWSEHNEKAFAAWGGHGCGMVMGNGAADPLRTLDDKQLNALAQMLMLGDIAEVPVDAVLLGKWTNCPKDDVEAETRLQAVAALVYLSGRVAADVPFLVE